MVLRLVVHVDGADIGLVIQALHDAADARDCDAMVDDRQGRLSAAVARKYRRIADEVEDARERLFKR